MWVAHNKLEGSRCSFCFFVKNTYCYNIYHQIHKRSKVQLLTKTHQNLTQHKLLKIKNHSNVEEKPTFPIFHLNVRILFKIRLGCDTCYTCQKLISIGIENTRFSFLIQINTSKSNDFIGSFQCYFILLFLLLFRIVFLL